MKEKNSYFLKISKVSLEKKPAEKYLMKRNKIGPALIKICSSFQNAVLLRLSGPARVHGHT